MAVNNKLFKYLCCPKCKGGLRKQTASLFCKQCRENYQIKQGIPILIDFNCLSKQQQQQIDHFKHYHILTKAKYRLEEWHKSFIKRFTDNFRDIESKVIIDSGTGQGYMAVELAKKGTVILSFDLLLPALFRLKKIIKEKGLVDKVLLVCATAEALPFKTSSADYCISNAILEHLEKEKQAIKEINRVCKKRSGLMITVPLFYRFLHPLFVLAHYLQDKNVGHLRRYDKKSLEKKLKKFGYQIKKVYYTGHFIKVILTLFFVHLFKLKSWEKKCEVLDQQKEEKKYGATNICAIFQKK